MPLAFKNCPKGTLTNKKWDTGDSFLVDYDREGEVSSTTFLDVWLRLTRKDGWSDRDMVLEHIAKLRDSQKDFENIYLNSQEPLQTKAIALELICFLLDKLSNAG